MVLLICPQLLYISTSVWVLRTPNAGRNSHFGPTSINMNLVFFRFLTQKTLKMTISTSAWGAQDPNAGRNIQHPIFET